MTTPIKSIRRKRPDCAGGSLAALTGKRYRNNLEESRKHERPEIRNPDRIWYEQIPCQGGAFIGLYSLEPLILHLFTPRVRNARKIWEEIKVLSGARAGFCLDGEAELFFPLEAVHTVAELAGAKKKRVLSPKQKAAQIERLKTYQFKGKFSAVQTPKITPI